MINTPAVTVIVPTFNQERFIGRCLRSLLSQDMRRDLFEIIVVDDGSTDRTPYALELFTDEITMILNERNLGLPASLNIAIRASRSPFVVRVDSDDYVKASFLSVLHMFLTDNPYMDAVACDYLLVDDRETVLERVDCIERPIACGILFRTDQLIDIGLYDEDFLIHEERDLRIRFSKVHNIHRLELPLYRYRKHDTSISQGEDAAKYLNQLIQKHGGKE